MLILHLNLSVLKLFYLLRLNVVSIVLKETENARSESNDLTKFI